MHGVLPLRSLMVFSCGLHNMEPLPQVCAMRWVRLRELS
jgi:hypothetical protein